MLKLVIRFLLTCCILFLGGHARTSQAPDRFSQNPVDEPAQEDYTVLQTTNAFFSPAPESGTGQLNDPLEDTEEKDDDDDDNDDVRSSKKHGGGNGGMASIYQQASAWRSFGHSNRLPFCEHLSYTSASIFIIHCVFRI